MSIVQPSHHEIQKYTEVAHFSRISAEPTPIDIYNQHLTRFNDVAQQHQVIYQGSADVVDILHVVEKSSARELCLFDTDGRFHNNIALLGLHEITKSMRKSCAMKHEARFRTKDRTRPIVTFPIDDIYSVSLAYKPEHDLYNPLNT